MLETIRNEADRTQLAAAALPSLRSDDRQEDDRASRRVADNLRLLTDRLAPRRRVVHAGDVVFAAGDRFDTLYVLTSGFFKLVNLAADGREQVVSLKFRGDWLGFDGIAAARTPATPWRWTPARCWRSATTSCSRPASAARPSSPCCTRR
jgi:CRP-like cAMP-binding protein